MGRSRRPQSTLSKSPACANQSRSQRVCQVEALTPDALNQLGAALPTGAIAAGSAGGLAANFTVQDGIQALIKGKLTDQILLSSFASALGQTLAVNLEQGVADAGLQGSDAFAARSLAKVVTSAVKALGNPNDANYAFASALLDSVVNDGLSGAGTAWASSPVIGTAFDDDSNLMPGLANPQAPLQQRVMQLQDALMVQGYAPEEANSLAWHRLAPLPDPFATESDVDDRTAGERIADQLGVPRDEIVNAGFADDAARSAALLHGFAEGVGFSGIATVEALVEVVKSPMQFVRGVKALLTSAEARGQFKQEFIDRIRVDVQMLEEAYAVGDWRATGQQIGKLTADFAQLAGGVEVLARLGVTAGSVGGRILVRAAQGFASRVEQVRNFFAGAQVSDDVITRIASNFGREGDAFTIAAEQMAAARNAGWVKPNGDVWYPVGYAVPGTEVQTMMRAGMRLDRYGGTGERSTLLAPIETGFEQRALPPKTNMAVRDEYIVLKEFSAEQSNVMPWFGKAGMGVQFNTAIGINLTIEKLVERGILKRVGP
jgi:Tuberculosis necrotizing toxin